MLRLGLAGAGMLLGMLAGPAAAAQDRPRVIVETDAGGDPDDEQSLVRFLLYSNDLEVEGIIANRPVARPGENRNPQRTGLGIVQRMIEAYGQCYPTLSQHDVRYPTKQDLWSRTVAGYEDADAGVELVIKAVDQADARPVWFMNWGTDNGAANSCLKRALDRVLRERGTDGYARFKSRLRLSSADKFEEHTTRIKPPFPIWVDTFRPEIDHKRWYHRFSAITARAGGFDVQRDVRGNHGPLGALYPLNTTHPQKEGDTMSFLYVVPTGMNDPEHPEWGSWAGRYGRNPEFPDQRYYWENQADAWNGTTSRDNTLARWAEHLQNDFRARLEWCVKDYAQANHPPDVKVNTAARIEARAGQRIALDASASRDPDGQTLKYQWVYYPEAGTYPGAVSIQNADSASAHVMAPAAKPGQTIHFVLIVTDNGTPPLTRYARVIVSVKP